MGQKINALSFRLGATLPWKSSWFTRKDFAKLLHQDFQIRTFLKSRLSQAGLSNIGIERLAKKLIVTLHTSKPGVVIGKKGNDIEKLKNDLTKMSGMDVSLNIVELRKPDLDGVLVAESIAGQIERRVGFRRAIKRAMMTTMKQGALGIRVNCSGRLGGAEIARMEWYREGRVPLHTIRADISYGFAEAQTPYGKIGVKAWIFRGENYNPLAAFVPKKTIDSRADH